MQLPREQIFAVDTPPPTASGALHLGHVFGYTQADCLAHLPWSSALDLYAWLTAQGEIDHAGLAALVRERVGRPGVGQLRRLLTITRNGAVSGAEALLHEILRRARLAAWRAGVRVVVGGRTIAVADVLFAAARLVIEVDGERAHSGRQAFRADRRRQNALVNAGYRVLRFTWWDLTEEPDRVVAQIRAALMI